MDENLNLLQKYSKVIFSELEKINLHKQSNVQPFLPVYCLLKQNTYFTYRKHFSSNQENYKFLFELIKIENDQIKKAELKPLTFFEPARLISVYQNPESKFLSLQFLCGNNEHSWSNMTVIKYLFTFNPPQLTERSREGYLATIAEQYAQKALEGSNWRPATLIKSEVE